MHFSKLYKVEAIILRRRNIGEADRVLTIFTKEYGKIIVIAKGIRKITSHRAPYLEIFSHVNLMLHRGKIRDTVCEANPIDGFMNLRKRLPSINTAYYVCELTDALLAEKQEHQDVFGLLTSALVAIEHESTAEESFHTEQFALTLLRILGYLPPEKELLSRHIQPFIERITERRIKTYQFLTRFS